MRTNDASRQSSTRVGASDSRSGPSRRASTSNAQPGAVAGARAAYTRPARPTPIYGPPPPMRTESALSKMYERTVKAKDTVRDKCSTKAGSVMPVVNNLGKKASRAASNARASVNDFIRANRRRRPHGYNQSMIGGQESTRIATADAIALQNIETVPVFVARDRPAVDGFAVANSSANQPATQSQQNATETVRELRVNETALAALEGRPDPFSQVPRRGLVNTIDRARMRREVNIPRRQAPPPSPPLPLYKEHPTPTPTYRSCFSSGRPSCKDVTFENNHDRRVTLWDMAAPAPDKTPDQSPTDTMTEATVAAVAGPSRPVATELVNPRAINLDKPVPDSPESSFEWPSGMIPLTIAVQEKIVTKEAAAAVKADNPHGKHLVPAPAGYQPR